jgi:hypothetical protein
VDVRGIEGGDERAPVLGEDGIPRGEQADAADEPRQHDPRTRSHRASRPAEQCTGRPREDGGDDHRLLERCGAEGLVRGDLPDGEDREPVDRV